MAWLLRIVADDRETAALSVGAWVKQCSRLPAGTVWLTLTDCYWHAYRYPERAHAEWVITRPRYRRFTFWLIEETHVIPPEAVARRALAAHDRSVARRSEPDREHPEAVRLPGGPGPLVGRRRRELAVRPPGSTRSGGLSAEPGDGDPGRPDPAVLLSPPGG